MAEIDASSVELPHDMAELTTAWSGESWLASLVLPEVGGGRMTVAGLDAIPLHPEATALRVSGLDQSTFERLVERHGRQFTALHFWKCPRIEDFSPLESLPDLRLVSIYWNQRTWRLWDLSRTPKLVGLEFEDFSRLRDLDDLRRAVAVEELSFGDKVWVKASIASLEPIAAVTTLRKLSFSVRKIEDGRIQPLAALPLLEQLDCSSNLFTTEQLAWLRAHVADSVKGRVLAPIQRFERQRPNTAGLSPEELGLDRDVLVMGKRRPLLRSDVDAARIQRYVDDYWRLVERFRSDPTLEPATA